MKGKALALGKALLWGCLVILFPVVSGVIAAVSGAGTTQARFLQGGFMVLALVPPLIPVFMGKWRLREIGFGQFNAEGCKRALYFIPLIAVLIPAAARGFSLPSLSYVLGSLFLYLFVGIAEEVYFRGIVPKYLGRAFSRRGVAALSVLIFGMGHSATAFAGGGALDTALTVLNALIFGWLAIEVVMISGNVVVPMLLHFLFDFETKITNIGGGELMAAELVRGAVMVLLAVWLAFVLNGKGKARNEFRQQGKRKRMRAAAVCIAGGVILFAGAVLAGLSLYGRKQAEKIPEMSFEDCLAYTLGGSADGVITVGVIQDGIASYTVYGENGRELPGTLHAYEIGSLTKTFTAALIQKAVSEGRICLSDTIDRYIPLPADNRYPTVSELLTHTSGCKGYYFETPMIGNFLAGRNDFYGITDDMAAERLKTLNMKRPEYPFVYSNYGYAVLGLVLKEVYGEEYTALVNRFVSELGLSSTRISNGGGDLPNCWDWRGDDAYLAAGALISNMEDMLRYAQLQLDGTGGFDQCHEVIRRIDATSDSNAMMDIRMDAIGMAWITDEENGIVWHNGGTGHYNCYLGFCPENGTAVVILSNLARDYRIPATVMGVKLLKDMA